VLSSETNGLHIDDEKLERDVQNGFDRFSPASNNGSLFEVTLTENKRVTPTSHWQDVRHLTFSTSQRYNYTPGDNLKIYPQNPPEDVDHIIHLMDWQDIADKHIQYELSHTNGRLLISSTPNYIRKCEILTLRTLLSTDLDLNAIPRRSFFALIAHFTGDEFQKIRLLEFAKLEFLDELYDYTTRPRRSILEVLQEFDTVKIPWQWAATVLPELRGRQFSIASGGDLKHGKDGSTQFELLVAIVKYKTVIKKVRQGVCTRYLADLKPGARLQVSLHKGDLGTKPKDATRPVIMIGPGTGVAPMRSLIWERYRDAGGLPANGERTRTSALTPTSNAVKDMVLFFGCRSKEADYFFRDEWHELEQKLPLKVFAAFSRDQKAKIYVQDLLVEQKELIFKLLYESSGIVYVCGSSGKMPQAVRDALVKAFQQAGSLDRTAAEGYLVTMEKEGRYRQETW
jgi:sulfite reductase alpha subunit-like flavoprotein